MRLTKQFYFVFKYYMKPNTIISADITSAILYADLIGLEIILFASLCIRVRFFSRKFKSNWVDICFKTLRVIVKSFFLIYEIQFELCMVLFLYE